MQLKEAREAHEAHIKKGVQNQIGCGMCIMLQNGEKTERRYSDYE